MKEFDEFSRKLLEESKRFLEKANQEETEEGQTAYLHASLVLGFSALEAYVNGIADDLLVNNNMTVLDKSILSEREIVLVDGEFQTHADRLKIFRLEDRIQFIYRRHKKKHVDKNAEWWKELKVGINLRNQLVHPKEMPAINSKMIEKAIKSIIKTIDVLFRVVYKADFPVATKGVDSSMTF